MDFATFVLEQAIGNKVSRRGAEFAEPNENGSCIHSANSAPLRESEFR